MTGRELYMMWCGSAVSDRFRYWDLMNPADRRAWEDLAGFVRLGDEGINEYNRLAAAADLTCMIRVAADPELPERVRRFGDNFRDLLRTITKGA